MGFNCFRAKKLITTETKSNKWSFRENNYGLWYIKDSRNIAGVVGIFFFLLMMIIFFTSVRTPRDNHDEGDQKLTMLTGKIRMSSFHSEFCHSDLCGGTMIICKNVNSAVIDQIQEDINLLMDEINNKSQLSLSFIDIVNPQEVIKYKWLDKIKEHPFSLTINGTTLNEINGDAFKGRPFEQLTDLTLISSGDLSFNRDSFSGLGKLTSLSIRGSECQLISAEKETFMQLNSLSSLQITGSILQPSVLKNLTGGETSFQLTSVKILDIGENTFNGSLLDDSFSKLPKLESLYLQRSDLHNGLDRNVFRGIQPQQLYLESTQLTKLPQGIFEPVIHTVTNIYLSGNKWNCTCDFQWFQSLYNTNKSIFTGSVLYCYVDNENEDLGSFNFCEFTSTTSTGGTSSQDTTTTQKYTTADTKDETTSHTSAGRTTTQSWTTTQKITPIPDNDIQCRSANRSIQPPTKTGQNKPRVIYLGKDNFRFVFTQIEDEPKFAVSVDRPLGNQLDLIFLNTAGWILCLTELHDNFNVENLEYGQSYTVCMTVGPEYDVSPRNCQSFTVPLEWKKQTWIANGCKVPVIIATFTIFFCILVFSMCGMFIYIKRNPNLVYGKENVIVVERENSKKDNQPEQNYERQKYPPSLISWSDGYLTPKVYESVEEFSVPCIDQYPAEYFGPRVYPTIRIGNVGNEDLDSTFYQNGEIYESVNFSQSLYCRDDDFSHKSSTSL